MRQLVVATAIVIIVLVTVVGLGAGTAAGAGVSGDSSMESTASLDDDASNNETDDENGDDSHEDNEADEGDGGAIDNSGPGTGPGGPEGDRVSQSIQNLTGLIAQWSFHIGILVFLIGGTIYGTGVGGERSQMGLKLLVGGIVIIVVSLIYPWIGAAIDNVIVSALTPGDYSFL